MEGAPGVVSLTLPLGGPEVEVMGAVSLQSPGPVVKRAGQDEASPLCPGSSCPHPTPQPCSFAALKSLR